MIVGFTGTSGGLTPIQASTLQEFLAEGTAMEYMRTFHEGDCVGADHSAAYIINNFRKDVQLVVHPPTNPRKRAFFLPEGCQVMPEAPYLERNHNIVAGCSVLVACPAELSEIVRSGTWATVRYARSNGATIYFVFPDGSLVKE